MDYIFTTISYGSEYHQMAYDLAKDMASIGKELLIFTDNQKFFKDLENVVLLEYEPHPLNEGKISGYDKDRIATRVFEIAESMWYVDADWRMKAEPEDISFLDKIKIQSGLTSAQGPMAKIHSGNYPKSCIEWARERYGVVSPLHYGEACYILKNEKKMKEYLRVLLEFGEMSDRIEIVNQVPRFISKSSGVSFGYAQQAAKLNYNSNKEIRKAFYSNFKHGLATTNGHVAL